MRVGLSFSRCVLDIVEGRVDISDVLVIISRTNFDPFVLEQWNEIWAGYTASGPWSNGEWHHWGLIPGAEDQFREVTCQLWRTGKLHQPRVFGAQPTRRGEFWLEAVLPSEELEKNPAAKKAWENFQTIAGLTEVNLDKD